MPFAQVSLLSGRDPEVRAAVIREVTDAIVRSAGVSVESVRVVIYDVPPENWGVAGISVAARRREA